VLEFIGVDLSMAAHADGRTGADRLQHQNVDGRSFKRTRGRSLRGRELWWCTAMVGMLSCWRKVPGKAVRVEVEDVLVVGLLHSTLDLGLLYHFTSSSSSLSLSLPSVMMINPSIPFLKDSLRSSRYRRYSRLV
jgi:hypothetical protein